MEMLIGISLLFQMLLLIKILQMDRQILQQMEEQKEKLIKITEQKSAVQKAVEKAPVSFAVSGQVSEEEKRAKTSEQEKLIDEVLSEIFPA